MRWLHTPLASVMLFAHNFYIVLSALVAAVSTSLGYWHLEGNHHFLFISVTSEARRQAHFFFSRKEVFKLKSFKTINENLSKILVLVQI